MSDEVLGKMLKSMELYLDRLAEKSVGEEKLRYNNIYTYLIEMLKIYKSK